MTSVPRTARRQRGAVAIVFGLMLTVLFAMAGFVLDLGHLYIVKAELQNGADGAVLAGATELNGTAAGINAAVAMAQAIAQKNKYDFSTALVLTDGNIGFGANPNGPWSSIADALASPAELTFIQVDTGSKVLPTYLMSLAGFSSVSTRGVAVAGRFVNDVTPIGVCAVDPFTKTSQYTYGSGQTELVEFGFRRGVSYNLFNLNPLGGNSDPYLINPVDAPPGGCSASHSSAASTAPFMCTGSSAVMSTGSGQVYTNTGMTASLAASLNSRFDDYSGASVCDPATAPPDSNIREYPCKGSAPCVNNAANSVTVTPPINWLEPGASTLPSQQTVSMLGTKPNYRLPATGVTTPVGGAAQAQFDGYGVLWSYTPAYHAGSPTTPFTPAQANANPMYSTAAQNYFDTTASSQYPTAPGAGFPAATPAAPYNQTSGPYFLAPPVHPGQRNRRVLNVVLVNCTVPAGKGACGVMPAVGIGKFFMQTRADFSGGTKHLDVEFLGLIEPVPNSEIKLYK